MVIIKKVNNVGNNGFTEDSKNKITNVIFLAVFFTSVQTSVIFRGYEKI